MLHGNFQKASANVQGCTYLIVSWINAYTILVNKKLMLMDKIIKDKKEVIIGVKIMNL